MLLCVPESWVERTQVLRSLGGKEELDELLSNIEIIVPRKEEKKEDIVTKEKEEEKEEVKEEKKEDTKETVVEESKSQVVEPDAKLKPVEEEDRITMSNSKTCPVKIVPTKKKVVQRINVDKSLENNIDESLEAFKAYLKEKDINFSKVKRVKTGLVETELIKNDGQPILITVDINDKLYSLGCNVFFIGKIKPLDEYTKRPIMLTNDSINAVLNGVQIDPKFYVPEGVIILANAIDVESIHEHNIEEKKKVLDKAFKAILKMQPEIKTALNGAPYRFSFIKYKNIDNFTLASSRKNRVSNLSDDKLLTSKEIKIEVKDDKVNMIIK